MEFGTFSSPESSHASSTPEHNKDTEDDPKKSKDKKKNYTAPAAAGLATDKTVNPSEQGRPSAEKDRDDREAAREAFWQKIKGKVTEPDTPDKPEQVSEAVNPALKIGETIIEGSDTAADTMQPTVGAEATANAQEQKTGPDVDHTDLKASAQEIIEKRLEAASAELEAQAEDTPKDAEAAASVAFLRAAREKMAKDSSTPVYKLLDAAESDVIGRIVPQREEANAQETDITEQLPTLETGFTGPVLPPDYAAADSLSFDAFDTAPPLPPAPPNEPPFGSAGGIPHPAFSEGLGWIGDVSAETIPIDAANVIPIVDSLHNERVAQNRGLLVGGIAGYFVGRRRGRRQGQVKAEKQARPIQRKLEQNIQDLQQTVASKQRHLESVVHRNVAALSESQGRKRLIEQLLRPAASSATKPESVKVGQRSDGLRVVQSSEVTAAAGMAPTETAAQPVGERYSRSADVEPTRRSATTELLIDDRYQHEFGPAGNVGRLLVEAPLIAAGLPLAAVEAVRSLSPVRSNEREQASVVPFNKKAEAFSHAELMETATKIKVEGTSLKEMVDLGRLDEPALRRVVGEFLEGGDVSAAVSREVKQKELKFERDPRMRQAAGQILGSSSGSASVDNSGRPDSTGVESSGSQSSDSKAAANNAASSRPGPTPDAATLQALRNKQVATVGATVLVIICAILAAFFLSR
jgi:hypothetical protein